MEEVKIGVSPDKLEELKELIEFKWRVSRHQTVDNKHFVLMVAYIDARDVMDRFDSVLGPENWADDYFELSRKTYCKISINVNGTWIHKSDVGTAGNFEKDKGETSDAFKRAAVKWGVNRQAYRIGIVRLSARQHGKNWFPCHQDGEFIKPEELADICKAQIDEEQLENYYLNVEDESGHKKVNDFFENVDPGK